MNKYEQIDNSNTLNKLRGSVAALSALAMLASGCSNTSQPESGITLPDLNTVEATESPEPTPSATPESSIDPQAMKAVEDYLTSTEGGGHDADDLLLGDDVDQSKNPTEAGAASFTDEELGVLDSNDEIAEYLARDTEKSQAVRDRLAVTYKDNPEELQRVLSGKYHIQTQFKKPVVIGGTSYFVDGKFLKMNSDRLVPAGDIVWVYVDSNGDVVPEASVRADCSNFEFVIIRPKTDPDDGLPGVGEVPADQDGTSGDENGAGDGEAGQERDSKGHLKTEKIPEPAQNSTPEPTKAPTPAPTGKPGSETNPKETPDKAQPTAEPSPANPDDGNNNNGPDEPDPSEAPSPAPLPGQESAQTVAFKYDNQRNLMGATVYTV